MKNLVDKNKNIYQYQEAIESQFQSICDPLYNFGVKHFGYIKIFPNGSYLLAAPSHKELVRQYCLNIKNQGISPTIEIESSPIEKAHYTIFSSNTSLPNKATNPILDLYYVYDLWPVFCIYKNRLDFIEAYCFSMNKNESHASGFYLNNLDLLEHFCDYFNDRAKDIIDSSDKKKRGYFDQKFNLLNQSDKNFRDQQIKQFLQETYIKNRNLKTSGNGIFFSREEIEGIRQLCLGENVKEISGNLEIPSLLIENSLQAIKSLNTPQYHVPSIMEGNFLSSLSLRQKECLFLLTRGKTAKQIGQTLGISHRTVETHIISLKNKMNCTTKNQLIEKVFDTNQISFMIASNY